MKQASAAFVVAVRLIDEPWVNRSKAIRQAREEYDLGNVELCQARDGDHMLLYAIPRKMKVMRPQKHKFSGGEKVTKPERHLPLGHEDILRSVENMARNGKSLLSMCAFLGLPKRVVGNYMDELRAAGRMQ